MRLPLFLLSSCALVASTVDAGQSPKSFIKRFNRLDFNGDAVVDTGEFAKLLPAKLTKNQALVQLQTEMFAWFDEDANAVIDPGEWLKAMPRENTGSPGFSDAALNELDANGDGKLTWKEFNRVIHFYVSAKTARRWFHELTFSSLLFSRNVASRTTLAEPKDAVSDDVLPVIGGPTESVMTTGGDCFGPSHSE